MKKITKRCGTVLGTFARILASAKACFLFTNDMKFICADSRGACVEAALTYVVRMIELQMFNP